MFALGMGCLNAYLKRLLYYMSLRRLCPTDVQYVVELLSPYPWRRCSRIRNMCCVRCDIVTDLAYDMDRLLLAGASGLLQTGCKRNRLCPYELTASSGLRCISLHT